MKIGDKYLDHRGYEWEIISKSGPGSYEYVGKREGYLEVDCFSRQGINPDGNVHLDLRKTVWLALNPDGSHGIFPDRPSEVGRSALIKVHYEVGQFDE